MDVAEADGGKQSVVEGAVAFSTRSRFSGRWSVGSFVEDMQLGLAGSRIGDLNNEVFRIAASTSNPVYQKDVLGHTGCVNAVEFDRTEVMLASGGDDMRVFVWHVADLMLEEKPKPVGVMERHHISNIFCYQFSLDSGELFSGGNDGMVIRHDVSTHKALSIYEERHPVYSISANPIDINVVAASREGGVVSFYDRRENKEGSFCLIDEGQLFRGQYNPANALIFATATNRGVRLYDLRNRMRPLLDLGTLVSEAIYVEWNSTGTALTALQSHSNPVYIDLTERRRVELKDPQYSNVHTIKSVTFMDDNMVMTGSDDFNIYAWRIPSLKDVEAKNESISEATFVLKGHRSIVNHVRYSPCNRIISSCGVEKIIKVWSALPIPASYDKPRIRVKKALSELTYEEGIPGDDTAEDLNMLNYFDQLDNAPRVQPFDSSEEIGEDSEVRLENYVVNVDLESLRAHLMGLETSDEGSGSEANEYDVDHPDEEVIEGGGSAEDETSARGSLRALRRRRWRMIRRDSEERRVADTDDERASSPLLQASNEHANDSSDGEVEGPRKRVRINLDTSDSSDNEFSVCEGGIPITSWPLRDSQSPTPQS